MGIEQQLANQLREYGADLADVKKTITRLSRVSSSDEDNVMHARGKAWHVKDGKARDVADVIDPRRAKSVGGDFGEVLQEIGYLSDPQRFHVQDVGRVTKSLMDKGAYSPTKIPPRQKAALAEGQGITGGYGVPPQYGLELLRLAAEESFLRQLCRQIPMVGREFYYPVLNQTIAPPAGGSSYFGGLVWTWQPEGSNYTTNAETEPQFRQVGLVARDLVGVVIASNQLLQDNAIALDTVLTTIFKEAMGWAYDYFLINGNGANQPLGFLKSLVLISVTRTTSAHFVLQDAANMLSQLTPTSYKRCVWMVHPSVVPDLMTMTTSTTPATPNNFLVWLNPNGSGNGGPMADSLPALFLGRPLFITEKVPKLAAAATGAVCLVDPTHMLLGDRMQIQIEASQYPKFTSNQTVWRIIARWDAQPEQNAPITLADGSYQVSPFVALAS